MAAEAESIQEQAIRFRPCCQSINQPIIEPLFIRNTACVVALCSVTRLVSSLFQFTGQSRILLLLIYFSLPCDFLPILMIVEADLLF